MRLKFTPVFVAYTPHQYLICIGNGTGSQNLCGYGYGSGFSYLQVSKQAFVHPKQLSVFDEQRLVLKGIPMDLPMPFSRYALRLWDPSPLPPFLPPSASLNSLPTQNLPTLPIYHLCDIHHCHLDLQ